MQVKYIRAVYVYEHKRQTALSSGTTTSPNSVLDMLLSITARPCMF